VAVTLKLIQIYVTDKKGNPVTDLEKSDFILYDNGKLQEITDFEKYIFTEPEREIEEAKKEKEVEQVIQIASRMNRKFFLLIDFYRNNLRGINKSKKAVQHFIETQIRPTDEVGVLIYSKMRGIVLHQYLTTDHHSVIEALKRISGVPDEEVGGFPIASAAGNITSNIPFTQTHPPGGEFEKMKTRQFATELSDFAKSLHYIPGYKNVVLFSSGVPRYLMYDYRDSGVREKLNEMARDLASSNVPVFSVNIDGARAYFKNGDLRGDHSLRLVSDLSGGIYFKDVDNYESIATNIQNVTSNYYVLGYYINETWDGKYHEIKVEVKRKGFNVNAQEGYFNPKPFTDFTAQEKLLHLVDLAYGARGYFQEPVYLPLEVLPCSFKGVSNLVMISKLTFDEIKTTIKGKAEIVTVISDEQNNIIEFRKGIINISDPSQSNVYPFRVVALSPGKYECRIILRDLKTGNGAVASKSVIISDRSDSRLDPPLLMIPNKTASYLNLSTSGKSESGEKDLSIADIYHFISNRHSPLVKELNTDASVLLAVMRFADIDFSKQKRYFSAELIEESSGNKILLSCSFLSNQREEDSTNVILLELKLPKLDPGEYTLNLSTTEHETERRIFTSHSFKVK